MTLSPIIKSDDPEFNHEFAQRMTDLVMKMDDEEARWFTTMVVSDVLEDTIEKNQRTLQRHLDDVIAKRIDRFKKATLSAVSKSQDDSAVKYAEALELFEKAKKKNQRNPYDYGYRFDESDFRRDPGSGRFQTKIHYDRHAEPLTRAQEQSLGISGGRTQKLGQMSFEARKQYQQEYAQIADFLNSVAAGGNLGDHSVFLHVRDMTSGTQHIVRADTKPESGTHWNPEIERVVGVEARPNGLTAGGAFFGLANSLGRPLGRETVAGINRFDDNFTGFSDDWTNQRNQGSKNTNDALYGRVAAGSDFVTRVAPFGSKAQIAARFGEIAGSHGPEAEKIIGPSARKAAYRYRGTEKTPDSEVVRQYDSAVQFASRPEALPEKDKKTLESRVKRAQTLALQQKANRLGKVTESVTLSPAEMKAERDRVTSAFMKGRPPSINPDAAKAGHEVLVRHLMDRKRGVAPDKKLYGLQLASGHTPPSEGFILDKNGKVVTQAIGYGDDHYLPFNLRNLKKLRGGEYIRTRSVGGPTSEDIYTGLMTGAQRITVVSRSGIFTVEFADDFRGKRRYNDKAHRMVRRYENILDTVQSEELERPVQVSQEVKDFFSQKAKKEYSWATPREQRAQAKKFLDEYKTDISMPVEERVGFEDFMEDFGAQTEGLSDEKKAALQASIRNDWKANNEFVYRLNGKGYEDGLKALQEQFPYYITSTSVGNFEAEVASVDPDKGYVEPGRNRPTEAMAGRYGTIKRLGAAHGNAPKQGKYSASQADYQGGTTSSIWRRGMPVPGAAAAGAGAGTTPTDPNAPTPTQDPKLAEARRKAAEERNQATYIDKSVNLIKMLKEHTNVTDVNKRGLPPLGYELANGAPDEARIRTYFKDKVNARKAQEVIRAMSGDVPNLPEPVQQAFKEYIASTGLIGRVPWDPKLGLTRDGSPFIFSGKGNEAYEPGADPSLVEHEVTKIDARTRPVSDSGLKLSDMDEDELKNEIDVLTRTKTALDHTKDITDLESKNKLLRDDLGVDPDYPGVQALLRGKKVSEHAEDVQRMRALNLVRTDSGKAPFPGPPPVRQLQGETPEQIAANKRVANSAVDVLQKAAVHITMPGDARREEAAERLYLAANGFKDLAKLSGLDAGRIRAANDAAGPHLKLAFKIHAGTDPIEESDIEEFLDATDR